MGLACPCADRLGIIAIVLLATEERLHILWADDLHLMPKFLELTRPAERPGASFDNGRTPIDLSKNGEQLITHDPPLQDDTTAPIDAM